MKRLVSILVLTLLFAHFTGYYFYFMVRMNQIRMEARQQLRNSPLDQLTKFTFTKDEFARVHADDYEIQVDGKMFDVARIDTVTSTLVVYAKHDQAEDDLLAFFNEVFAQSWADTNETPSSLTEFLSLNFLVEPSLSFPVCHSIITHSTAHHSIKNSVVLSLESPPPRV